MRAFAVATIVRPRHHRCVDLVDANRPLVRALLGLPTLQAIFEWQVATLDLALNLQGRTALVRRGRLGEMERRAAEGTCGRRAEPFTILLPGKYMLSCMRSNPLNSPPLSIYLRNQRTQRGRWRSALRVEGSSVRRREGVGRRVATEGAVERAEAAGSVEMARQATESDAESREWGAARVRSTRPTHLQNQRGALLTEELEELESHLARVLARERPDPCIRARLVNVSPNPIPLAIGRRGHVDQVQKPAVIHVLGKDRLHHLRGGARGGRMGPYRERATDVSCTEGTQPVSAEGGGKGRGVRKSPAAALSSSSS